MRDKSKYPILSVRLKPEQMDYIRREARERNLTVPKYVRKVLVPFELPVDKIIVDKL